MFYNSQCSKYGILKQDRHDTNLSLYYSQGLFDSKPMIAKSQRLGCNYKVSIRSPYHIISHKLVLLERKLERGRGLNILLVKITSSYVNAFASPNLRNNIFLHATDNVIVELRLVASKIKDFCS